MQIILLSGGSGQRLWPLSNDLRSKQFLKIFGGGESMLQRVLKQIRRTNKDASITIAAAEKQVPLKLVQQEAMRVLNERLGE